MSRICTRCRTEKPLDSFPPHKRGPDGRRRECSVCYRAYLKIWRAENLESKRAADRAYAATHAEKAKVRAAEWSKANPDRKKETGAAYRREKSETIRAAARERRAKNRIEINAAKVADRKARPDFYKEMGRRYRQKNKGAVLADRAFRKARKRNATPGWLTADDKRTMRFTYELAVIASETLGEPFHVDHITPLAGELVCGLHVPRNLRVIRAIDNLTKGNRT